MEQTLSPEMQIEWRNEPSQSASAFASVLVASLDDPRLKPSCVLPPTREDDADRAFPGASGRSRFQERRSLLRAFVGNQTGCAGESVIVSYDPEGAPRVVAPSKGLWISTAGRGDLVALVCAVKPVGIDLEILDETIEPVDTVLHPVERTALLLLDPAARVRAFLRIWTMKEAWLKARRTGFRRDPCEVAILEQPKDRARIEDAGATVNCTAEWKQYEIAGRTILAACVVALD